MTDFETKYRDLVAGVTALHVKVDHVWEDKHWCQADGQTWPCATIALLASSPAEREGEGGPSFTDRRFFGRGVHPAPVSSGEAGEAGEAGEPLYAKYLPSEACPVCRGRDVRCATCRLAPRPAPVVTPSAEGSDQ